jgi:hypothetical protein
MPLLKWIYDWYLLFSDMKSILLYFLHLVMTDPIFKVTLSLFLSLFFFSSHNMYNFAVFLSSVFFSLRKLALQTEERKTVLHLLLFLYSFLLPFNIPLPITTMGMKRKKKKNWLNLKFCHSVTNGRLLCLRQLNDEWGINVERRSCVIHKVNISRSSK